jgi:hypothetical protein
MTWTELCSSGDFHGLWVALDNCRYDRATHRPLEGDVVDADPELAELCARMREAGRCSCAIFLAEEDSFRAARSTLGGGPRAHASERP